MRQLIIAVIAVACGCAAHGGGAVASAPTLENTAAPTADSPAAAWIGGAPAQSRLVVGSDGQTYVGIWVEAPELANQGARPPMAISLVIDTSGSMEGEKIQHARMAASSLLETMAEGDIVSIYAFSSGVAEIAPPTVVSRHSRGSLLTSVQMLTANGGTNMYDGLRVGTARMSEAPATHSIRRVVVISDGQANIGPSDPLSLGSLAAQATEWGTQITSIGVGLDYDESTLAALAVRSSGRLYHLQAPSQMAEILRTELDLLAATIATDAIIEFVPAPHVRILDAESVGATVHGGRLELPIGTLHSGQRREVLFRVELSTQAPGTYDLGAARLTFSAKDSGERIAQVKKLDYEITTDRALAERSATPRVEAMVASKRAQEAQLQAVTMLNEGRASEAVQVLTRAEAELDRAAAANADEDASGSLRQQATRLRAGRASASKAASSPAPAAASRAAALENYDSAYDAAGY